MRLIILDRDGVINKESDDFIKSPAEWIPIPGSLEAITRLNRADYRVVVATNQSGIARNLFDLNALTLIHEKMHRTLAGTGGSVEAIFFCPHGPDDDCKCRKPKPGLLHNIAECLHTDLDAVPAIGDSARDIEAALSAGAQPILVRTGKGAACEQELKNIYKDLPVYDDLSAAVDALLDEYNA